MALTQSLLARQEDEAATRKEVAALSAPGGGAGGDQVHAATLFPALSALLHARASAGNLTLRQRGPEHSRFTAQHWRGGWQLEAGGACVSFLLPQFCSPGCERRRVVHAGHISGLPQLSASETRVHAGDTAPRGACCRGPAACRGAAEHGRRRRARGSRAQLRGRAAAGVRCLASALRSDYFCRTRNVSRASWLWVIASAAQHGDSDAYVSLGLRDTCLEGDTSSFCAGSGLAGGWRPGGRSSPAAGPARLTARLDSVARA